MLMKPYIQNTLCKFKLTEIKLKTTLGTNRQINLHFTGFAIAILIQIKNQNTITISLRTGPNQYFFWPALLFLLLKRMEWISAIASRVEN